MKEDGDWSFWYGVWKSIRADGGFGRGRRIYIVGVGGLGRW